MTDGEKVMSWLEGLAQPDWRMFHSDSEVQEIARNALALLKEQTWHKMNWDEPSGLEDHFYYLVTIPRFGTPMKAKWHEEGYWQVLGIDLNSDANKYVFPYDEESYQVIGWMDLPEVYREGR